MTMERNSSTYFNFLYAWARLTTVGSHISLKEVGMRANVFSNHQTAFLYLNHKLQLCMSISLNFPMNASKHSSKEGPCFFGGVENEDSNGLKIKGIGGLIDGLLKCNVSPDPKM